MKLQQLKQFIIGIWAVSQISEDHKLYKKIQMHGRIQRIIEVAYQMSEENTVHSLFSKWCRGKPSEKNNKVVSLSSTSKIYHVKHQNNIRINPMGIQNLYMKNKSIKDISHSVF